MGSIKSNEILYIINPNSGNKKTGTLAQKIHAIDPNITVKTTTSVLDLEHTMNELLPRHKVIIMVGGDGTVNESLKYLYGQKGKILTVLPAGSGNGFARELEFKNKLVPLIEDAKKGKGIEVDVLSVNNRLCINVAGLGFDSFVAHDFQSRSRRGLLNYVRSTLKSIKQFKPFEATITINGKKTIGTYQMISIANTRQFGNNALISPLSKPNNRKFDLVLVKPFPLYRYLDFVVKLFSGTFKNAKHIQYLPVQNQAIIESSFNKHHVDGEPFEFTSELSIQLLDTPISVLRTRNNRL